MRCDLIVKLLIWFGGVSFMLYISGLQIKSPKEHTVFTRLTLNKCDTGNVCRNMLIFLRFHLYILYKVLNLFVIFLCPGLMFSLRDSFAL